ncbi:MAG TPA: phosphoribosylanthranilate isomerase [Alphaproteobacteria bacterium]|nr:phosphoribosylanthranilate isomerase [Alphaproteobacteria bacterium]
MKPLVKICGITHSVALGAAIVSGADFVGFIFYPPSPRYVAPGRAAALGAATPPGINRVGVFVDPADAVLGQTLGRVRLDFLQLHGHETPERIAEIKERFGLPIIKSVAVSCARDVDGAGDFASAADWLLFDAKPPRRADALPGGNAVSFDWTLLTGRGWSVPHLISGGLDAGNVGAALASTEARGADVSSGVEHAPGDKDPEKIAAFLQAARGSNSA